MEQERYVRKENNVPNSANSGLTLVELIVVVLIFSILLGSAIISASVLHEADADAAADKLTSVLSSARNESLARETDTIFTKLYKKGDNYYVNIYNGDVLDEEHASVLSTENLGNMKINFIIKQKSNSDIKVSESVPVYFTFRKNNGELDQNYSEIEVSSSKTVKITVIKETGRCLINE